MPDGRVLIALEDGPLEPSPTWTRIDDTPNLVAEIEIHRGRQTELDTTDTSTATVRLNDTQGLFDPANSASPYFGQLDGKQILLQLRNPVTGEWVSQFRGFIDDFGFDLSPSQVISNVQIECVDLFDFLAGIEMVPGQFGNDPTGTGASPGTVVYDSPFDQSVQARIKQMLADAFRDPVISEARSVVFTGNVDLRPVQYDPGDSMLAALRDAADAEFPTISNLYTDKLGRFVFHGRQAKFDPDTTASGADWTFTRWKAGDGAAVALDSTRAQLREPLTWSRPRRQIINAAMCYPRGIAEPDIPGQIFVDSDSLDAYGYRAWSATDLIVQAGTTTGNDANAECLLFAQFIVEHYKDPHTRVEALTFRTIHPSDPRAAATWGLICGADISDIVDLKIGYPNGVGLDQDYFIEGSEMTIRPGDGDRWDDVTLTLDISQGPWSA